MEMRDFDAAETMSAIGQRLRLTGAWNRDIRRTRDRGDVGNPAALVLRRPMHRNPPPMQPGDAE